MESLTGYADRHTEETTTVRKMSKFKVFKSRIFGRLMKKDTEGRMKQSQSTGDVTTQECGRSEDDSEDDCHYPNGALSSRALSHDSIFLADPVQSSEPARVLSQENVHSKIKALQLKLQQQNIRLVPPPLLIPGRRIEDSGTTSEDDGLPCSPPELSFQEAALRRANYRYSETKKHLSLLSLAGTGSEEDEQGGFSQPSSRPLSPAPPLSPKPAIFLTTDLTSTSDGVDFGNPIHCVSVLDNSAARYRMSIKPRNQRASTKGIRPAHLYRPKSNSMNNLDQPLSEKEETLQNDTLLLSNSSQYLILPDNSFSNFIYSQEQQKTNITTDDDPVSLSKENEETETLEPLQFVRLKTKTSSLSHLSSLNSSGEATVKQISTHTKEHLEMELLNNQDHSDPTINVREGQPNVIMSSSCVITITTDNNVTKIEKDEDVREVITDQFETMQKTNNPDSTGPLTRSYPVPVPRNRKPTLLSKNNSSPKRTSTNPSEGGMESGDLDESLSQNDILQRPGSFRFSIVSAKYRSKSGELVTKQDEECPDSAVLFKNQSTNSNLAQPVEKVSNNKNTEICRSPFLGLDKRTSMRREVMIQNGNNAEKSQGCFQNTEYEKSKRAEEPEDGKGLFGVKLRSTSLSLKYRFDLASSEDKVKRHSLEAHHILTCQAGSESSSSDIQLNNYIKSLNNPSLSSSDNLHLEKGKEQLEDETENRCEPVWMSSAREKTKSPPSPSSKPPVQLIITPNSVSSFTFVTPSVQPPQKPTPQPRPQLSPSSKTQPKTCINFETDQVNQSSLLTQPKPAPKGVIERWSKINQQTEKSAQSQSTNADEPGEVKGTLRSGTKSNNQTESEQQSQGDRAQPAWMELAKRKSLAWSDMSMD